jgi:transposase
MAAPCPECGRLQRRIADLEAENTRLRDELERCQRAGKRQAAPFSKGPPIENPKTPGRKAGAAHGRHGHRQPPAPEHIDETYEAPLPCVCPYCCGPVIGDDVVPQFQTEVPLRPRVRQFNVYRGHCATCRVPLQGRHPLQTSDALGAAASQIGPEAQAAIVYLNKHAGLSYGKIADALKTLCGVPLTRGACAQIVLRAGERLASAYAEIQEQLRRSPVITPDETGWRIGGQPAWLHGWVGVGVTCYHIGPGRSADALMQVIGADWSGYLTHDGAASYDRFEWAGHQQCQAHVLRRAHEMEAAASGRARVFPRQVIDLLQESLAVRDQFATAAPSAAERQAAQEDFTGRLFDLTERRRQNAANEQLATHLYAHGEQWFQFLVHPEVPATNYQAEQALKPAVVNRKVWGGNRTPAGAKAQEVTMSVLQTCKQRALDVVSYISQTMCGLACSLFAAAPQTSAGEVK